MIQTAANRAAHKGEVNNSAAIDYYLSGIKIDPQNFSCVYNVACSYFYEGKICNSLKWFEIGLKIDPNSADSSFGKAVCCIKLGKPQMALEAIENKPREPSFYNSGQFILLEAICNRILGNYERSAKLYEQLQAGMKEKMSDQVVTTTCALILLPLNPNRRQVEYLIENFYEILRLYDPSQYLDGQKATNLKDLTQTDGGAPLTHKQNQFLAQYLCQFPFLSRCSEETILDCLESGDFRLKCLQKGTLINIKQDHDSPVYLLLNGKVVHYAHSLDNPYDLRASLITKPGLFFGV